MSQATPNNKPAGPVGPKTYSVPRRYDLATLFTVSLAYALLFGAMRLMSAPPTLVALVALFVTVVGLAQALVLKGNWPRLASILAGYLFCLTAGVIGVVRSWSVASVVETCFYALCPGVIAGYLAGLAVAGVFLVADLVRKALRRLRHRGRADESVESTSTDDSFFAG